MDMSLLLLIAVIIIAVMGGTYAAGKWAVVK